MYDDDSTAVRGRPVETDPAQRRATDRPVYVTAGPGPVDYARRIVTVVFLIVQALLALRIVLLLLVANRDNAIVQAVMNLTDPLVQPFVGMFRVDDVRTSSGSVLDVAAVAAFVAVSLLEAIVLAILGVFGRRETAVSS